MYENGKKYDDIKEYITKSDPAYKLELKNENNDYIEFAIKKKPNITTPGLNLIFKKDIEVKRVIYYDE